MSENKCGSCRMCCKFMTVRDDPVFKGDGEWCQFCDMKVGCTIYESRPPVCQTYECLWLLNQHQAPPQERFPLELRPDKCKVMFAPTTNPMIMMAHVEPHRREAWREEPAIKVVMALLKAGAHICISDGPSLTKTALRMDSKRPGVILKRTRHFTPPDENGIQWHIPDGEEKEL